MWNCENGPLRRMRSQAVALALIVGVLLGCARTAPTGAHASPALPAIQIVPGSGDFVFVDQKADPSKRMTVFTYLPKDLKPSEARIVFVMHGMNKNASDLRDYWAQYADKYRFMVLAPLFDLKQWPGNWYAYESVVGRWGWVRDKSQWSYSAIEHLFDAVKSATGNASPTYFIYGHSEGGQFVHRFVELLPDARYERAVAANPGWYTVPTFAVKFPYGLKRSPATRSSLAKSLGRRFTLLLGDQDTDPNHPQLRRTTEAMAQGPHRFARGQHFFAEARKRAEELKCPFAWELRVVPGAAHDGAKMSTAAAPILMQGVSPVVF
jgi:hypothetical protein